MQESILRSLELNFWWWFDLLWTWWYLFFFKILICIFFPSLQLAMCCGACEPQSHVKIGVVCALWSNVPYIVPNKVSDSEGFGLFYSSNLEFLMLCFTCGNPTRLWVEIVKVAWFLWMWQCPFLCKFFFSAICCCTAYEPQNSICWGLCMLLKQSVISLCSLRWVILDFGLDC